MPSAYAVLGVPTDADDAAIRARYLQLIREFSPENAPEAFARIRAAFETIATVAARADRRVLNLRPDDTLEELIAELSVGLPRRRVGLDDLIRGLSAAAR